jgi:hypothetical protein
LQADNALANTLYQEISTDTKIDEATARKYYDEHKGDFEQARARHTVRMKGSPVPVAGKPDLTEGSFGQSQRTAGQTAMGADFAAMAKTDPTMPVQAQTAAIWVRSDAANGPGRSNRLHATRGPGQ